MNALIISFLKNNGGALDIEIAQALKLSIEDVKRTMEELSATGSVISCSVIRYNKGQEIHGTSWRLSGSLPAAAPGPKIGAKQPPKSVTPPVEDE